MRFSYHRPDRVQAAAALAAEGGRILAGGQSLMPLVKRGTIAVKALVDINRLHGLDTVTVQDGWVAVGALVRLEALRTHPLTARHLPLLKAALAWVANPAVRMRGTLVGNLVHNGPGAEAVAAAAVAGVKLACLTAEGTVTMAVGYVPAGGLVVAALLKASPTGTRAGFYEVQKRFGHLCTLGCGVELRPVGTTHSVLAGLIDRPLACPALDAALAEGVRDDCGILAAIERDLAGRPVRADIHATAQYRWDVAPAVVRRALAATQAEGAAA